jgi:hypothetical protein
MDIVTTSFLDIVDLTPPIFCGFKYSLHLFDSVTRHDHALIMKIMLGNELISGFSHLMSILDIIPNKNYNINDTSSTYLNIEFILKDHTKLRVRKCNFLR